MRMHDPTRAVALGRTSTTMDLVIAIVAPAAGSADTA